MIKRKEFEAKTKEEAMEQVTDYYQDDSDLLIEEEIIPGKLFKSSKCLLKVISYKEILDFLKNYLEQLSKLMQIPWQQEIRFHDDSIQVLIISEKYNPIIIGKEGKNLDSLQYLIRQTLFVQTGVAIRVNVDIANYKKNKVSRLEQEVKKIVKDVILTKEDVSLDPMNSYERRIIHTMIQDMDKVETESIGEGKYRHIVIKYVEK